MLICRVFVEQVETLLKTQEPGTGNQDGSNRVPMVIDSGSGNATSSATANFNVTNPSINIASDRDMDRWRFNEESPQATTIDDFNFNSNIGIGMNNVGSTFTWEMIGLGLEEPLPPQDTIDELYGAWMSHKEKRPISH
jgi:hypothetical protein